MGACGCACVGACGRVCGYHVYVRCPMSDVRCPMSDVRCPMSDVRCPMSEQTECICYWMLINLISVKKFAQIKKCRYLCGATEGSCNEHFLLTKFNFDMEKKEKRQDILKECFEQKDLKKIKKSTIDRFKEYGTFTAIFRPTDYDKECDKYGKSGGKTIYNFETETAVYLGYTSSELAEALGLPKRQYKKDVEQISDTLCALRYFRASLLEVEAMGFSTGLKLEIVDKWISDTELSDNERAGFEERFAANIPLFPHITEALFMSSLEATEADLALAKKLGYRFSDTSEASDTSEQPDTSDTSDASEASDK